MDRAKQMTQYDKKTKLCLLECQSVCVLANKHQWFLINMRVLSASSHNTTHIDQSILTQRFGRCVPHGVSWHSFPEPEHYQWKLADPLKRTTWTIDQLNQTPQRYLRPLVQLRIQFHWWHHSHNSWDRMYNYIELEGSYNKLQTPRYFQNLLVKEVEREFSTMCIAPVTGSRHRDNWWAVCTNSFNELGQSSCQCARERIEKAIQKGIGRQQVSPSNNNVNSSI